MNVITLQATTFVNHPQGTNTFGYRMYDDHGQAYDNTLESIPTDDLELLRIVMESDDHGILHMLSFLLENGKGINIGDEFYPWEQIKHLWNYSPQGY